VTIVNDTVAESTESFDARLFNASGASISTNTAPVTIQDDDGGTPALSAQSATVNEGAGTVTLSVSLSPAASSTVTVNYATIAGTAVGGQDYFGKSGTLTFNPGQTSRSYTVTIINDSVAETVETFSNRIFSPSGASISTSTAPVTINDND